MSLAAKLPFRHRYAAGFPGLGSQAVPTDADALDYLDRMAAADGTSVEVGVATAVDAFFRDAKESGVFDALKACCILAGARTLAGALVPVVGTAPTNLPVANGFVEGDYTRGGATPGLKGDGTSYLDSGRANNADPQNDCHLAAYKSSVGDNASAWLAGSRDGTTAPVSHILVGSGGFYNRSNAAIVSVNTSSTTGLRGTARASSASASAYYNGTLTSASVASVPVAASANHFVFAFGTPEGTAVGHSDATLAFYSIGTSLSLEDLDTAVTNLITAIGEAL